MSSPYLSRFTIPGPPVVLKNRKIIAPAGPRCPRCRKAAKRKLINNAKVDAWLKAAVAQMKLTRGPTIPAATRLHVEILSYVPTRAMPDLDNSFCAPLDALQKARVITDDAQVASLDGSRVIYDPDNPRTVITIRKLEESDG